MVLLETVAVFVGLCSLVYLYFKTKFSYWKNLNVAYIEPTIPKGNLKDVGTKYHVFEVFEKFYNQLKGDGKFFGVYLFTQPAVVVTDMDLVKTILVKDANSFMNRGMYYNQADDPLSAHLFNIDQPHWKVLRAKLSPTFSSGIYLFLLSSASDIEHVFNWFRQDEDDVSNHCYGWQKVRRSFGNGMQKR